MPGFERIVTDVAKAGHTDVANRHPALECVMTGAMENVRDAYRGHGCGCLQSGESCRIIDHLVGEETLLSPTGLEVARVRVIHAPGHGDSGKEQKMRTIPEGVCRRSRRRSGKSSH